MSILVQLCDLVAPIVLILRTNMGIENILVYILEIQNTFLLLKSSPTRGVRISTLRGIYFSLTWGGSMCI